MKRHSLSASLATLTLLLPLGLAGCRERPAQPAPHAPRETRERAEAEALEALLKNPEEIRRRVYAADIEVPGTEETRVHLVDGKGTGPGTPPAWSLEARGVVGMVPGGRGIDVFADLADRRPGKPLQCYLILLRADSIEAAYTSRVPIAEGARILAVRPRNAQGEVYDLEVEYTTGEAQGAAGASPAEPKTKVVKVAHHFLGASAPRIAPLDPHGRRR